LRDERRGKRERQRGNRGKRKAEDERIREEGRAL
jgi:hypothetical protein